MIADHMVKFALALHGKFQQQWTFTSFRNVECVAEMFESIASQGSIAFLQH